MRILPKCTVQVQTSVLAPHIKNIYITSVTCSYERLRTLLEILLLLFTLCFAVCWVYYLLLECILQAVYGRVLIITTECVITEVQCCFRRGRGCMDQVFAVRQLCEKYLTNGKCVFWAIIEIENAFDTINRHGMWQQMLRVYGVEEKLLKEVQNLYVDRKACV